MRARPLLALVTLLLVTAPAFAQDAADELAIPPPPSGSTTPDSTAPATAPTQPTAPIVTPPSGPVVDVVPPPPSAGASSSLPIEDIVQPLLAAAEADMAAGNYALALARATLVRDSLPESVPQRIRAEGFLVLAEQRMGEGAVAPTIEEVLAPQVAQAELDVRARRPEIALPRLDFALSRLPGGTDLRGRAERLREIASQSLSLTSPQPRAYGGYGAPAPPEAPERPPQPPRDPNRRGGGEAVELYIMGALFGALSGGYVPFAVSEGTAGITAYSISVIAGAGLFAVGVLALDLNGSLRTGVAPTISASLRFGFANGMLALGIASAEGVGDSLAHFSLVWGGTALGVAVGLAAGFGLQPRVHEERFIESVGIWGGVLGTGIALLTEYEDASAGLGLSLGGLDAGILIGLIAVASGVQLPVRRTLFLDLGFLGGAGLGAGVTAGVYSLLNEAVGAAGIGVGMLAGSVAGWALLYALTDGMEMREGEVAPVSFGVGPTEGGGTVTMTGLF